MSTSEAIVRFTAGQPLQANTFPIGARAVYTYSISPTGAAEAYIDIVAFFYASYDNHWHAQIKFTASPQLWDEFYVDSHIKYSGHEWQVDQGRQLGLTQQEQDAIVASNIID